MKNMTALVSLFARDFHYRNNTAWIFKDDGAGVLLFDSERENISRSMATGISYFAPGFTGTEKEALRFIVDTQLSPTVLARSAFCEDALSNAVRLGCRQYVIFACGYDTFSLRNKNRALKVFELDYPDMISDKQRRIAESGAEVSDTSYIPCDLSRSEWQDKIKGLGFRPDKLSFGSLLGLSFYLTEDKFTELLKGISELWCRGSSLLFDYPTDIESEFELKTQELAAAADEKMKAKYSYKKMEKLLEQCGFLIYEHHDGAGIESRFFEKYNSADPRHTIKAFPGVNYCLAVKK